MADGEQAEPRQGWGSWAASVAVSGVGAVSSAAYTLAVGGSGAEDAVADGFKPSTTAVHGALRNLTEVVETLTAAAEPTAKPTAEGMLDLVYDLLVPGLHKVLVVGLRPPPGWLPRIAGPTARRSVWELFTALPKRAAGATHDNGYYDSLKKTTGFVQEEVAQWRADHGLEHEVAIPSDAEPMLRGAPHEFMVLVVMGLQEGVLGKWLRVVLGDVTYIAQHYESDAAMLCDSGTAQRVIDLAESLDALQLGTVADEGGAMRRIGRTQQGLPTDVEEVLGPALAAYEAEETIRLIRGESATQQACSAQSNRRADQVPATGESARPRPVIVLLDQDEPITVASPETEKEEEEEEENWSCQPCSPPAGTQSAPAPAPTPEPEPEPTELDQDEPITVASLETKNYTVELEEENWSCQPCSPPAGTQSAPAPAPAPTPEPEPEPEPEPKPTEKTEPQQVQMEVGEMSCQPCAPP